MYVKVPAVEGVPLIGTRRLFLGVSLSPDEAVCHIDDGPLEEGWEEITEEEFRQYVSELEPEPEPEPSSPQPTLEEQLARLEEQNLIIMDALADLYEEILTLKEEEA